jgi:hypothetical protein
MSEQNINTDFQISSLEEYQKATEMLHNNVFDINSNDGKKMKKIIEEINKYHSNNFQERQNLKKSVI